MTPAEYRACLTRLGETQGGAARLLGVEARTSQRYACGERAVPPPVERLLWAIERDASLREALRGLAALHAFEIQSGSRFIAD